MHCIFNAKSDVCYPFRLHHFIVCGKLLQDALHFTSSPICVGWPNCPLASIIGQLQGLLMLMDSDKGEAFNNMASDTTLRGYLPVILTVHSFTLVETKWCQVSNSHVIFLCQNSQAPFFWAFYLYLDAFD